MNNFEKILKNNVYFGLDPSQGGLDDRNYQALNHLSTEYFLYEICRQVNSVDLTSRIKIAGFSHIFYYVYNDSMILSEDSKLSIKKNYLIFFKIGVYPSLEVIKDSLLDMIENDYEIASTCQAGNFAIFNLQKIFNRLKSLPDIKLNIKELFQNINVHYWEKNNDYYRICKNIDTYVKKELPKYHSLKQIEVYISGFGLQAYVYNTEDYISKQKIINNLNNNYITSDKSILEKEINLDNINEKIKFDKFVFVSSGFFSFWILDNLEYNDQEIMFYDINAISLMFKFFVLARWSGPKYEDFDLFIKNNFSNNYFASILIKNFKHDLPPEFVRYYDELEYQKIMDNNDLWIREKEIWQTELTKWKSVDKFQSIFDKVKASLWQQKIKFLLTDITTIQGIEKINYFSQKEKTFLWISNIFSSNLLYFTLDYDNTMADKNLSQFNDVNFKIYNIFSNFIENINFPTMILGSLPVVSYDKHLGWKHKSKFTQTTGYFDKGVNYFG